MPFKTRNPYYLRISEKNVLPVYLYLDERHLDWMSDMVLQHVLADLRPHILPKLKAEASLLPGSGPSSKKPSVDTHRGETYQFCYFIRKTEPHSVVVKTRHFVARPPQKRPTMPPPPVPSSKQQRGKRKAKPVAENGSNSAARKKRKTKGKGRAQDEEDEFSASSLDDSDDDFTLQRLPTRSTKRPARGYQENGNDELAVHAAASHTNQTVDVDMVDQTTEALEVSTLNNAEKAQPSNSSAVHNDPLNTEVESTTANEDTVAPQSTAITIDLELEEEEKPKPLLQLKYQGFGIYGHCLCIVVEPWPPIRSMSRAPSVVQLPSREPSIAPPSFVAAREQSIRAKTPLFLPDFDRERSMTPAPFRDRGVTSASSFLDPAFLDDSEDSEDGGMMQFSQVLNATGDIRAGAADDDEDMDNAMFFGDADEAREL